MASDITLLLHHLSAGDDGARDRLYTALYPELKRLARSHLAAAGLTPEYAAPEQLRGELAPLADVARPLGLLLAQNGESPHWPARRWR